MTPEPKEISDIITKAQQGNHQAKNQLVKLMQDNGYMKIVNRYLYMNRLLEPEDARSEFWLGVILALPKCKTNLGDPLFYLAWSGVNRVKEQLRGKILKGVSAQCLDCGWAGRLHHDKDGYHCKECGSTHVETRQKEINATTVFKKDDEQFERFPAKEDRTRLERELQMDMERVKERLSPQELKVFIMITEEGVDRDNNTNYLLTISQRLRVTPQCINVYLQKIRSKFREIWGL